MEFQNINNLDEFVQLQSRLLDEEIIDKPSVTIGVIVTQIVRYLSGERRRINAATASWDILSGKEILDIGCGGDGHVDGGFKPWLARILSAKGAKVTGVDIAPQIPEDAGVYEHIKQDIIPIVMEDGLNQLSQLKGREFDVVNAYRFVGYATSPTLEKALSNQGYTIDMFTQRLLQQSALLVKEGGLIMFAENKYRKIGGILQVIK